jgi:hypothetical protein
MKRKITAVSTAQRRSGFILMLAASTGLLLLVLGVPATGAPGSTSSFDHNRTGFPLLGAHAQTDCQSCHFGGVFQGTPRQCALCHVQGSRRAVTFKPANHVQTNQPCELCHTNTVAWTGARFQHSGVVSGACTQCHNGSMAPGKPAGHVFTTASCDTCHRTTAWIPATFNHANVTPGSCAQCHNGTTATGKPANHIATTASCDLCHTTSTWLGAKFDHTGVTPGTCETCHNGTTATGKSSSHMPTTVSCDACHNTTTFTTSTFNHSATQGVVPGQCEICHNGAYASQGATGKSSSHIPTTVSCDACHNTTTFTTSTFNHTTAQGVVPGQCEICHNGAYTSEGAQGKPKDHPTTTLSCDAPGCHNTTTFSK